MQHQAEYYKQRLIAAQAEAKQRIKDINDGGLSESLQDSIHELSSYDNHPADIGSEVFERSKDMSLREMSALRLDKISRALDKLEEGSYGICDGCGKPIAEERLEAEPEANVCIECRREFERHDNPDVRPIEEEVIAMPYGGDPDTGRDGATEFDGEDSWQAAARTTQQAEETEAGSYYGGANAADEELDGVTPVEGIPYFRGADGVIYEDGYGQDDETAPREVVRGDRGWDKQD